MEKTTVTIESTVQAPVQKVWDYWTIPRHITQWCNASDDWHAPHAEADLRKGGSFSTRMEAKDGSIGFDFGGIYDEVTPAEYLAYTLGDDRKVSVRFEAIGDATKVTESFETEPMNSVEMQKAGWQAILDNFKRYTEKN